GISIPVFQKHPKKTRRAFVNLGYKVVLFPVFFLIFVLPPVAKTGATANLMSLSLWMLILFS
ncbi:hypothetical protein EZS27_043523, partial [termite gut metagenome]